MTEEAFLKELTRLRTDEQSELSSVNARFKQALLIFGSETEDNLRCVAEVDYGIAHDIYEKPVKGLRFSKSEVLLSDVFNHAENSAIPDVVSAEFPEVSLEEWQAALRLFVLILLAIDKRN